MYAFTLSYHKEINLSNERELKANLEVGFAKLSIARGKSAVLFRSEISTEGKEDLAKCIDYAIRDGVGYLNVNSSEERHNKKKSLHISGFDSGTWETYFTDEIPISFDVELGLGKGDFDFTGLSVKDLNLSAGASSVTLRFDTPNKSEIEELTIEAGLSKFEGKNLCNANFRHMKFEGGVGSYRLDFGGSIEKEMDADIEVGLGSITVLIPQNIGARIIYEKNIISHFDIDSEFSEQSEDNYISSNYYSSSSKINLHIDAGLGTVKIRRN
jgi:hypothetical protein